MSLKLIYNMIEIMLLNFHKIYFTFIYEDVWHTLLKLLSNLLYIYSKEFSKNLLIFEDVWHTLLNSVNFAFKFYYIVKYFSKIAHFWGRVAHVDKIVKILLSNFAIVLYIYSKEFSKIIHFWGRVAHVVRWKRLFDG